MGKQRLMTLGLVLGLLAPAVFAAPAVLDTDGDGVPDNIEAWLQRQGAPVSPTVFNVYTDTDGDLIPDLVEQYLTQTNPAVNDNSVCAGGGGPVDITGQYDVRVATNLANPQDFLSDDLLAVSICHTSGGVKVYNSRWGYANTVNFTGSDPYTLEATWLINGNTATATCTGPCTTFTGTANIGAGVKPMSATRRTVLTGGSAAAGSALYGIQIAPSPKPGSASAYNPDHLGSEAAQISIDTLPTARFFHKDIYDGVPGYYVASVGTAFFVIYDTYTNGGYTETNYTAIGMTVTEPPALPNREGGMIRGGTVDISDSTGNPTQITEQQLYAKAKGPLTYGITVNRTIGVYSQLSLNNVPESADAISISGTGLPATSIYTNLDDDPNDSTTWFNNKEYKVNHRYRLPGFTDGEKVGFAGNGNDINVSVTNYNHTGVLGDGTYTFSLTGAVGGYSSVDVTHTDYSATPLPVVTGLSLDGAALTSGRPNGKLNVNTTVNHTLTWDAVKTGGVGNNGVGSTGVYRLIISDSFGNQIQPAVTGTDQLGRFFSPGSVSCAPAGGATCTATLDANSLPAGGSYRIVVEARDDSDSNNRSRTDRYYINTPRYRVADFSADGTADIVWRHEPSGVNLLWQMNGFNTIGTGVIGGDLNWTPLRFYGDFNDDGFTDLLWRHTSGQIVLWNMIKHESTEGQLIGGDSDWSIVRIGDFNGDGYRDLLWRQASTGATVMWLMRGFEVFGTYYIGGDSDWTVIQTGDFNGDRKADILWRQASTGLVLLWTMDGPNVTSSAVVGGDTGWTIVANGDFNGDGKRDLLWRHTASGLVVMWLMNGAVATNTALIGGDTSWDVRKVGDYNGDGKWDILWRNNTNGLTLMWQMDGTNMTAAQVLGGDLDWTVQ